MTILKPAPPYYVAAASLIVRQHETAARNAGNIQVDRSIISDFRCSDKNTDGET